MCTDKMDIVKEFLPTRSMRVRIKQIERFDKSLCVPDIKMDGACNRFKSYTNVIQTI